MKRIEIEGCGLPRDPTLRQMVREAREKDLAAFAFSLLAGPRAPWKITVTIEADKASDLVADPAVTAWRVV